MTRYQWNKKKKRIQRNREAGRRGGIRSQQVQRERRMELNCDQVIYPLSPRWSFGLRDNWSGESAWFTFVSFRDTIRRVQIVMANLVPVVCKSSKAL